MANLHDYTLNKKIGREIDHSNDGLATIYKAMKPGERAILDGHNSTICYKHSAYDLKDCKPIKEKYNLSWSEIVCMIKKFS